MRLIRFIYIQPRRCHHDWNTHSKQLGSFAFLEKIPGVLDRLLGDTVIKLDFRNGPSVLPGN